MLISNIQPVNDTKSDPRIRNLEIVLAWKCR